MRGPFAAPFARRRADHVPIRAARKWGLRGAVIAAAVGALVVALIPLSAASAQGPSITLGTPSGATTTGVVVNFSWNPGSETGPYFIVALYEPSGTAITPSSPQATDAAFTTAGQSGTFSIVVDQLQPSTTYSYELEGFCNGCAGTTATSSTGTITTTANPTGPGTPIIPGKNPPANGVFGFCGAATDQACLNDSNGTRAAQEQLPPISLPPNWSSLSGSEKLFVMTNLERTSRGEAAIPNLVNTYAGAVQTGLTNDADPSLAGLPGQSGAIWAGAYPNVVSAMYGWLYDDGPGGENEDCTTPTAAGCWGHRDNILADPANIGSNPTEMDAGVGTDSSGNVDYDATFDTNTNAPPPGNLIFTWAEEQAFIGGTAPSISGVSLSGTPAAPTVTVTGSNLGAAPTTSTPETCQPGDTGTIFSASGLIFSDLTEGWGAGEPGDCIGLLVTSWSSTRVVFTLGSQYANFGPIKAGDQVEVSILGATDTVTASFTAPPTTPVLGDFTGSGSADIALYRPASGTWYINGEPSSTAYGTGTDVPVPGDYLGNGKTQIAVYRPGTGGGNSIWYIDQGTTSQVVQWGTQGDIPVPGDYLGSGQTQVAVYRPGTAGSASIWYIQGEAPIAYGTAGDIPVPGDYLGNGKTQIAVFRPATGTWYIDGGPTVVYGGTGDIPVQGDYLGNGSDQIAVYRPGSNGGNSTWYIDEGTTSEVVPWGTSADVPVPADYLGNGKIQIAVYRPGTAGSASIWYIDGIAGSTAYGTAGDVPVLARTVAG